MLHHVGPTGDFEGDLSDNVADLSAEQYAGLLHWRDFYHKVGQSKQEGDGFCLFVGVVLTI